MSNPGSSVRTLRLTGKARAVLDAADRITPERLFDDRQLTAITKAGYRVYFLLAEPIGIPVAS